MARLAKGFTRRKDGRLQYRFTVNGARYTVYGWTTAEAREKEQQKRQEIAAGLATRGRNVTVCDYVERWIEGKRGAVKSTTIRTYKRTFPTMLDICVGGRRFGDMKLVDVETQDIRLIQQELTRHHSTRTVNHYIALLSGVMRSAINDERLIIFNPVVAVKSLRDTAAPAREGTHRALTKAETRLFFEHCKKSWYAPLYAFLLATGCRCGEAGALQVRDVHKDGLQITRTLTMSEDGAAVVGDSTKTESGKRAIPLTENARLAITAQKKQNTVTFGNTESITDIIFRSPTGRKLCSSSVNADICKICASAGIDRFCAHAFRDTFATRCIESGMDYKTLQTIMGHSDIGMTMNLYAHVMQDTKEKQLRAVNFY